MDDSQTHSKPLPQGQFSSSLLSFSLCLEFVQLQPRSLLLCIAITLLQLHIAKLECPFMCSEGKLCSALLWVSKEPSPGLVLCAVFCCHPHPLCSGVRPPGFSPHSLSESVRMLYLLQSLVSSDASELLGYLFCNLRKSCWLILPLGFGCKAVACKQDVIK